MTRSGARQMITPQGKIWNEITISTYWVNIGKRRKESKMWKADKVISRNPKYMFNHMYFNNDFRFVLALDKRSRKPKERQSRMDNPETLATLGTQDEDKQSNKPNTENWNNEQHWPYQNIWEWTQGLTKGNQILLLIRYQLYFSTIIKSGKNIVGDRGKNIYKKKEKIHCKIRDIMSNIMFHVLSIVTFFVITEEKF